PYTAPDGVTDITLTGTQQAIYGNNAGDTFHSDNNTAYLFGGTGGEIIDFGPDDKVDLTGLLAQSGYTGSDPVGAGFIKLTDDGQGDAQIWSNLNSTWWLVTTVEHIAPSGRTWTA